MMSDKPTTAEIRKQLESEEGTFHFELHGLALHLLDRLEAANKQLSEFVWSESNPSEYVNELTETLAKLETAEKRSDLHEKNAQQKFNMWLKAEQTIKEISEYVNMCSITRTMPTVLKIEEIIRSKQWAK